MTQNLADLLKKSFQFILLSIFSISRNIFWLLRELCKSEMTVMYYLSFFCSPVSSDSWVNLHVSGAYVSGVISYLCMDPFKFFCMCACVCMWVIYICVQYLCICLWRQAVGTCAWVWRSDQCLTYGLNYSPPYSLHSGSPSEPGAFSFLIRVAASKPQESFCLHSLSARVLGRHRTPSGLLPRCWNLYYNPHTSTSTLNHWAISPDPRSFYL